jgi:uncharacterized repeat protein (TIGR03803 family)
MTKPRIDGLCVFVTLVLLTTAAYTQSFSVLYNFGTKSGDPCNPDNSGIVAQGRDGSLYSAAPSCGAHGDGAVFKITLEGAFTVLHSFNGTDGRAPYSGLRLGTDGNFYGTTSSGGASGSGTLFKITPSGSLTVLHNFTNGSDGGQPFAPPIQGIDGNFYGTTVTGGGSPNCSGGCGIVYKITSQGTYNFASIR